MNKLFLALALLSFVLAPFDFVLQDLWEGLLPVAWGALFLFLAFRDRITAGSEKRAIALQWLLGLAVIAAGILKLLARVDLIG
jgi:hypothetical protein